ncbi:SDR family NAD(P)-dependent oxidoreductase [Modestobacter excelsi]|uniref:SDR family NAD(P)-dependent oxidoreductase n=1 Tax=Modestobacter excelsi TaxID=2213161 RepID=UPI00110CCDD1|nr:SDR family NAD(P)-dependent oxidoreductase [Modestobacter excelsi]
MRLADRVVAVTGAAGGMGEGVARVLLEEGAQVALWDLSAERTGEVAARVDGSGLRTLALAVDVTDEDAVRAAVQATVERFGALDGLVNNAGTITMNPAWDASAAEWRRQLEVNVTGSFVCAQAVGRHLKGSDGGRIVNVSSNAGKAGYPNMAAYNASKAAVIGLTRSLAMEWAADGINVNAVCPGGVDTPMLTQVAEWLSPRLGTPADELLQGMGASGLGGRRIRPEEVGRVIAFLLSDDAVIIRGQSISVDGGDTPY